MIDTRLILSDIVKNGLSIKEVAQELGITCGSLYNKIHNKTEFKASEIVKISALLHVEHNNFFARYVDNLSTTEIHESE